MPTNGYSPEVFDLLKMSIEEGVSLGVILADIQEQLSLASPQSNIVSNERETNKNGKLKFSQLENPTSSDVPHLLSPIDPPEVWASDIIIC